MHVKDLTEIAALAWNETKAEEDPIFDLAAHKLLLLTAAQSIFSTGSAGIQGLEAFEAHVVSQLKELAEAAEAAKTAEPTEPGDPKQLGPADISDDTLPIDFPGREALEADGFTTLSAVRALDPSELTKIPDIGPATAAKITAALKEE